MKNSLSAPASAVVTASLPRPAATRTLPGNSTCNVYHNELNK